MKPETPLQIARKEIISSFADSIEDAVVEYEFSTCIDFSTQLLEEIKSRHQARWEIKDEVK